MNRFEQKSARNHPAPIPEKSAGERVLASALDTVREVQAYRKANETRLAAGDNFYSHKENSVSRLLEEIKKIRNEREKRATINQHAQEHAHAFKEKQTGHKHHETIPQRFIEFKHLLAEDQDKVEAGYKKLLTLLHPDNIKDNAQNAEQRRLDREKLIKDITVLKQKNIARFKDIAKHFGVNIDIKL